MEIRPAIGRAILSAIGIDAAAVEPLASRGVAHDHFRLVGTGLILRLPIRHPTGLDAGEALEHQAEAFRRARRSGHVPRFHQLVPPSELLPLGALVVEEIKGRPPRLPEDMEAIVTALAAIHRLPVPPEAARPPLDWSNNPILHLLSLVRARAPVFTAAGLHADSFACIAAHLAAVTEEAEALAHQDLAQPLTLIGADVHPGNFLIDEQGRAIFTDLERAYYGHPGADIAHATLYTSTRWDPAVATELSAVSVEHAYANWEWLVEPEIAAAARPAHRVLRRLVWLRTLGWMAQWRIDERKGTRGGLPRAVADHARRHAEDVLSPATLTRIGQEWQDAYRGY